MKENEIAIIRKVAALFAGHEPEILEKWVCAVRGEGLVTDVVELEYFQEGFKKLIDDFVFFLSKGDLEGYYHGNSEIAVTISYNDISYSKFVEAFHLFEDSYGELLAANVPKCELLKYIGTVDKLHHKTIATVSGAYFDIKDTTVFALARLAELRDPETGFHLERTREYSQMLAKKIGCDEKFLAQIYKVGPLHDIGKVGIPDRILLKPGPLTAEEYEIMKKHPVIGGDTIESIIGGRRVSHGYLLMARDIARYHHEKFDGSGYPEGLSGEKIPLAARIFALADAYDAIVSKRPYKPELPHEEAVARITRDSGTHFDPALVAAFVQLGDEFAAVNRRYREEKLKMMAQ